ncbi:MAG: hypothetical protein NVSMB57_00160 [Actinomycetota bacterium]
MTEPGNEMGTGLGSLTEAVQARCAALDRNDVINRIWKRDHTVWRDDPTEIADRLGWLDVAETMRPRVSELQAFATHIASQGFTHAVLLGMGGSSLCAETISSVFGVAPGALNLRVLDSTHPAAIRRIEQELDLRTTLFIVASKSGSTIETLSHLQYFFARIQRGTHFCAITDPGSDLATLAESHGFAGVFLNPPDIGGRYSALSLFGLVPAALIGADLEGMLDAAIEEATRCKKPAPEPAIENEAALLGVAMAEAALAGRYASTFVLPEELAPLGVWIEQLIAESTGKDGRGILPVVGEPLGGATAYGPSRFFVSFGEKPELGAIGAPFISTSNPGGGAGLGAAFFRMEMATAIAGHVLGIQPFDQPNVAQAKHATAEILQSGGASPVAFGDPFNALDPAPGYLGILAYVDPSPANAEQIERVRIALRTRLRVPVTATFGPRYLHSTGQLHKGGPEGGAFLIVSDDHHHDDVPIPGRGYTFGTLIDAQAAGDHRSLRDAGRRVETISLETLKALT